MNRDHIAAWPLAAIAVAVGSAPAPARAEDAPRPILSIDPVVARSLLAPIEEDQRDATPYRLVPGPDASSGQRAKLSVDVGDATLFAITGRLNRQPVASGPLPPTDARAFGQRRDSGKVYGGGVSHHFKGIELSGTYQYSKVTADQPQQDREMWNDGPGKSHSVKATARIRFKP